jgi:hypothetical protein
MTIVSSTAYSGASPAMRRLVNWPRASRLMHSAVINMALDLRDMVVLTELGSGPFVVTPLLAAMAGAKVIAVTRDSQYGTAEQVTAYGYDCARKLDLAHAIQFSSAPARNFAAQADIVTNLGFVRPIDTEFVDAMKAGSAICLMWEPWELRDGDVDVSACRLRNKALAGTNEAHPLIRTLDYMPLLAAKLILECEVELCGSHILVIGSDPFGSAIDAGLMSMGAHVHRVDPLRNFEDLQQVLNESATVVDAIVLAEHRDRRELIGPNGINPYRLAQNGIAVAHICGVIDAKSVVAAEVIKNPKKDVAFGFMSLTTDYLGPRPVIDLHAGGLKVGEIIVRAHRDGAVTSAALEAAVTAGYGLAIT